MTAEECLLGSLFAMVSNDCHVRNARATTTGFGMLPSETSLAIRISTCLDFESVGLISTLVHRNPGTFCGDSGNIYTACFKHNSSLLPS